MNYEQKKQYETAKKYIISGRWDFAQNIINELILSGSDDAEILMRVGELYIALGKDTLASVYIRQSFDLEKSVEKLKLLADVNFLAKKYDQSAIQYEELIKHIPSTEIYQKCIRSYEKLDLYEEAIRIGKMFNDATGVISSYSDLIYMYIVAGMEKEAIEMCDKMEEKFPNQALTNNIFGFLYECIYNDYDKAKEYFRKSANQGFIEGYYNLGICCRESEDLENAEKYLKRLISLQENPHNDCYYALGTVYLSERKLRMGYQYYQKRKAIKNLNKRLANNLWDGKDYPDETLYISIEGGYGDNIAYLRYLPFVLPKFKKVIYGTRADLVELVKASYPQKKYTNLEIVSVDDIVKFNKFVYIMDLPYLLHMNFHNIPSEKSYIVTDKTKVDNFKTKFFDNNNFKLGLCWRAKGMGLRDAVYRTIDAPYYFKPIMDLENTSYYSFQFGDIFDMCKKYPQITDLTPEFKDFTQTAAALKNLDVLITVDTALAHLAGALGVKTYLLLCHAPDWRWFDNDKKTEWYPSVTIIKQQDRKTWEDVSEKLTELIKAEHKKHS